ncbi:hypothetical protein RHSIM_Rhsim01G0211100 [Rhododendron simsii]|uniref:Coiled-coil SMC6 And NSE5 INteracting (CANIN) domain-containing protein n=1 Tax=Rhododendron simsii TaxID=118357 RepID=A0A834HTK6_RHOSS|nr:hypothetical protein RHSIM_Rhsim01G0211100 [Rhododendron simsii]
MMATDDPLDFESEDRLLKSPALTKRRKKVIGLDDLVNDYLKENKRQEMKSKQAKAQKNYFSDEEDDIREAKLSECVEKCQQEAQTFLCLHYLFLGLLIVFGNQKNLPQLAFHELGGCGLLQSFMHNELNSLVELDINKGEAFLESLLVNGWLLKLLDACGHVEKSIATWTYNLMLYSVQEVLSASACDFWITILSPKTKVIWISKLLKFMGLRSNLDVALSVCFVLLPFTDTNQSARNSLDSDCGGPPQNIRAWIMYVAACFQVRYVQAEPYTKCSEELVVMLIYLFLDRQLLGLSVILHECMLSAISFFTDNEWSTSSEEVAKSIACRVPKDMNCLRTVESISGVDARSKHLRRAVAFRILVACLDIKATDAEEILRFLNSINVKDKSCDLFKIYIYLVLTENWLLYNPTLEDMPVIHKLWGVYLRHCSCQITSTDMRTYASKVRSKASYLLQGTNNK